MIYRNHWRCFHSIKSSYVCWVIVVASTWWMMYVKGFISEVVVLGYSKKSKATKCEYTFLEQICVGMLEQWNSAGTAEKLHFLTLCALEPMYQVIKKALKLRFILLFWFFVLSPLLVIQKYVMLFLKLPFSVWHIYFRKEGEGGGHVQWLKNFNQPRDNFKILGPPWYLLCMWPCSRVGIPYSSENISCGIKKSFI